MSSSPENLSKTILELFQNHDREKLSEALWKFRRKKSRVWNFHQSALVFKIVYFGPPFAGKSTNLETIYQKLPEHSRGEFFSYATDADRTLYFDFEIGRIEGLKTRLQVYTVPGEVISPLSRQSILKDVDGIVFVADSSPEQKKNNIASLQELKELLIQYGHDLYSIPFVMQWNKRDLSEKIVLSEFEKKMNYFHVPSFETVAIREEGVVETFLGCINFLVHSLMGEPPSTNREKTGQELKEIHELRRKGASAAEMWDLVLKSPHYQEVWEEHFLSGKISREMWRFWLAPERQRFFREWKIAHQEEHFFQAARWWEMVLDCSEKIYLRKLYQETLYFLNKLVPEIFTLLEEEQEEKRLKKIKEFIFGEEEDFLPVFLVYAFNRSLEFKKRARAIIVLKTFSAKINVLLPTLIRALKDKGWLLRKEAAWILGRVSYSSKELILALEQAVKVDPHQEVRDMAKNALQEIKQKGSLSIEPENRN